MGGARPRSGRPARFQESSDNWTMEGCLAATKSSAGPKLSGWAARPAPYPHTYFVPPSQVQGADCSLYDPVRPACPVPARRTRARTRYELLAGGDLRSAGGARPAKPRCYRTRLTEPKSVDRGTSMCLCGAYSPVPKGEKQKGGN
jgi:hypothetical protein